MHGARVISETYASKGLFGRGTNACNHKGDFNGCHWQHETDFWATDTPKVWNKSQMCATCIPDAGNPLTWGAGVETKENKKIFVPQSKNDQNKKSHEHRT
jgi:hypothetical protein